MAPRHVQPPTPPSCLQLRGRGMQGLGGQGPRNPKATCGSGRDPVPEAKRMKDTLGSVMQPNHRSGRRLDGNLMSVLSLPPSAVALWLC